MKIYIILLIYFCSFFINQKVYSYNIFSSKFHEININTNNANETKINSINNVKNISLLNITNKILSHNFQKNINFPCSDCIKFAIGKR